jgi:hypothetical protein
MIMRIAPIIKAIWISQPKLRKKIKPSSHKTRIIIPIINKILIIASFLTRQVLDFSQASATSHKEAGLPSTKYFAPFLVDFFAIVVTLVQLCVD